LSACAKVVSGVKVKLAPKLYMVFKKQKNQPSWRGMFVGFNKKVQTITISITHLQYITILPT